MLYSNSKDIHGILHATRAIYTLEEYSTNKKHRSHENCVSKRRAKGVRKKLQIVAERIQNQMDEIYNESTKEMDGIMCVVKVRELWETHKLVWMREKVRHEDLHRVRNAMHFVQKPSSA